MPLSSEPRDAGLPSEKRAGDGRLVNYEALAASEKFRELIRAKRRFVVPAMIVFLVYYFALPVLVGYARPLMLRRVLGAVNWAYLFALSQFFMAWTIAAFYVRAANRFDKTAREIRESVQ